MTEVIHYLGYAFRDSELLKRALTHCSTEDEKNNERLEFLGDGMVNFVIAEALYQRFPHANEGELTRWRASLVNRDALADLARELKIGRFIRLGAGEAKAGGHDRQSILSCTMEALIGAMYCDGGFDVTQACILRWYEQALNALGHAASHKDPKTKLQEYCQKLHYSLPLYSIQSVTGEPHQQIFVIDCTISPMPYKTSGTGSSRRGAEQAAAQAFLEIIKS